MHVPKSHVFRFERFREKQTLCVPAGVHGILQLLFWMFHITHGNDDSDVKSVEICRVSCLAIVATPQSQQPPAEEQSMKPELNQ